ncbi:glutaredoxin 3 [Aurantimonas marianensis]|uniref:Glutaredoxin n=1 Tax=Aurantimonas marianensis TaxID=2920428 RepID=A0A9X2KFU0_9HYPH|nr:glutaredoxin 3 [Aurantimonas marianensis]MCP3056858.1 glutaredoxin 3 [Aurantimonas marianensis]
MPDVTIYTRQFCGFCVRAKQLLDQKGLIYEEKDASSSPQLRQEMYQRAKGTVTFPQIFIGETHVGGCDDLYALERAGKLDALLSA